MWEPFSLLRRIPQPSGLAERYERRAYLCTRMNIAAVMSI
jgi:hypothetical protein